MLLVLQFFSISSVDSFDSIPYLSMSTFVVEDEEKTRSATKLYESTTLRGGASIIEVNGKVITFGGVDREQNHLNDCIVCQRGKWLKVEEKGDVPTARSGHAVTSYGKFMFLYGGIDFTEEIAYNDLYILDTESMEWKYVGEAGMELKSRNSHSLGIVNGEETQSTDDSPSSSVNKYLVVYGGASPEEGPIGDTVYALLPSDPASIDITTFFVTWQLLSTTSKAVSPGKREMHGTSSWQGNMVIVGGRDEQGNVLSDVWTLTGSRTVISSSSHIGDNNIPSITIPADVPIPNPTETNHVETAAVVTVQSGIQELKLSSFQAGERTFETENATEGMAAKGKELISTTTADSNSPLMWVRLKHLELPVGRCAHGAAILDPNTIDGISLLCLYGGFTAEGSVSETVIATSLSFPVTVTDTDTDTGTIQPTPSWSSANIIDKNVPAVKLTNNKGKESVVSTLGARFGHAMCSASVSMVQNLLQSSSNDRITTSCGGFLVFGGVSPERDYGDVWLVI